MIISLGPKRLIEPTFQKKGFLPDEKKIGQFFHFTEHGRPQKTFYQAGQGLLTIIVQAIVSFPEDL